MAAAEAKARASRRQLPITGSAHKTRVVCDALMSAIAALLQVTTERGSAATLDRGDGAPMRGGQRRAMLITESRAEVAEHIRHL